MTAKVYIDMDATITTYNFMDIKMPKLCGDLATIHMIIEVLRNNCYTDIPKDIRIANADIFFRDHTKGTLIPITLAMAEQWASYIINPNPNPTKPSGLDV